MKIYTNLEQGTPEWLEARRGVLTASVIGKLITPKTLKVSRSETARSVMNTLIAEHLTGRVEPIHPTWQMQRGTLDEPYAREAYMKHTGNKVEEVGFITQEFLDVPLGYSPDGLVGVDGLIEIKSRSNKAQLATILADYPPLENMAQLQTGLLVTGRKWIDYVSFSAGMPLYVKRVQPDQDWVNAILNAVNMFAATRDDAEQKYQQVTKGMPVMDVPEHYFADFEPEITIS